MHDTAHAEGTTTRRSFLRAGTATVGGAAMVATAGTASAQSQYGGYLDDVGNFDGTVVDETGADQVTITVGAQGNGGTNAFAPPAVRVSPGTTVVWEWEAGFHNVVDDGGAFESETSGEAGFTFEQTFEETGVIKYYCAPHRSVGMKGVVDVVEGSGAGDGGGGASGGNGSGGGSGSNGSGGGGQGEPTSVGSVGPVVPSVLALAFVVPAVAAALLGRDEEDSDGSDRDR